MIRLEYIIAIVVFLLIFGVVTGGLGNVLNSFFWVIANLMVLGDWSFGAWRLVPPWLSWGISSFIISAIVYFALRESYKLALPKLRTQLLLIAAGIFILYACITPFITFGYKTYAERINANAPRQTAPVANGIQNPARPVVNIPVVPAIPFNLIWTKISGEARDLSYHDISICNDRNYIVGGYAGSNACVRKYNVNGGIEWEKQLTLGKAAMANRILPLKNGGYIGVGWVNTDGNHKIDALIFKLNADGELEWSKQWGGDENDSFENVVETSDGNLLAVGWTFSKGAGDGDAWVMKLNAKGQLDWEQTYGGKQLDVAMTILPVSDGYLLAGESMSTKSGSMDIWLFKINNQGALIREKTFGGDRAEKAIDLQPVKNNGFVVVGWTESKGAGQRDGWILKFSANGELEWDRTVGSTGMDELASVSVAQDGSMYFCGKSQQKSKENDHAWILKTDAAGKTVWEYIAKDETSRMFNKLIATPDNFMLAVGETESLNQTDKDGIIIKFKDK